MSPSQRTVEAGFSRAWILFFNCRAEARLYIPRDLGKGRMPCHFDSVF